MRFLIISKPNNKTFENIESKIINLFPKENYVHRKGDFWLVSHLDDKKFSFDDVRNVEAIGDLEVKLSNESPSGYSELVFTEHACNGWLEKRERDLRVLLSELSLDKPVDCDGEVITVESVINKIKNGEKVKNLFTLSDEWFESVLHQSFKDIQNGSTSEKVSAPNKGKQIVIDL